MRDGAAGDGRPSLRAAEIADIPVLEPLIAASARALGRGFYTTAEVEAAIAHVYGVDRGLIADRSYLVAERGGRIVGCGGWSSRRTLFGGDHVAARDDSALDPARDAARIRAFFVVPDAARLGIGASLLAASEQAAAEAGFHRATLMATLPGVPFYASQGYVAEHEEVLALGAANVRFVAMSKPLLLHCNSNVINSSSVFNPKENNCQNYASK